MIREGSIMSIAKEEKNYHDRCEMIKTVNNYYRQKKVYNKYLKELEYLALFHAYFIPAKEILFRKGNSEYIDKFRNFVRQQYPEYMNNEYLSNMSKKEKLQFWMIDHKQYWVVQLLSKARQLVSRNS